MFAILGLFRSTRNEGLPRLAIPSTWEPRSLGPLPGGAFRNAGCWERCRLLDCNPIPLLPIDFTATSASIGFLQDRARLIKVWPAVEYGDNVREEASAAWLRNVGGWSSWVGRSCFLFALRIVRCLRRTFPLGIDGVTWRKQYLIFTHGCGDARERVLRDGRPRTRWRLDLNPAHPDSECIHESLRVDLARCRGSLGD